MNILIDENVSAGLVGALRNEGRLVHSVFEDLDKGLSDDIVWKAAKQQQVLLITRYYHFLESKKFYSKCNKINMLMLSP